MCVYIAGARSKREADKPDYSCASSFGGSVRVNRKETATVYVSFVPYDRFISLFEDFLMNKIGMQSALIAVFFGVFSGSSLAYTSCKELPKAAALKKVFIDVINDKSSPSGGDGHPAWMTLVDASGTVCAVVTSLEGDSDVTTNMSGLGHRLGSAYKANTSNTYSHDKIALSTANLYTLVLPGGPMAGHTLPTFFDPNTGNPETWGTPKDPMVGKRVGGFMALAGGLPLFDKDRHKVGAIGVSGNPYCTAHTVAWKVREKLGNGAYGVANLPGGIANGFTNDAMIQDYTPDPTGSGGPGKSASGFGYPTCSWNPPDATDGGSIEGNQ